MGEEAEGDILRKIKKPLSGLIGFADSLQFCDFISKISTGGNLCGDEEASRLVRKNRTVGEGALLLPRGAACPVLHSWEDQCP